MPSYVAWTTAICYQLYRNVLTWPVALLLSSILGPSSSSALLSKVLSTPFHRAASWTVLLGCTIQTGVLLEEYAADRVGEWVNARFASVPINTTASRTAANETLLTLLEAAESPASSPLSYASTLSALLTKPLTLPVPIEGGSPFSSEEIRDWEEANEVLKGKVEGGMEKCAERWIDVLEFEPAATSSSTAPAAADNVADAATPPYYSRADYLTAVRQELELINSRKPTRAVYREGDDLTEEEWLALEAEERSRSEAAERALEEQFSEWLQEIFAADEDAEATRTRKEMVDVPLAGVGQPGPTWRDQLRVQWRSMFDTREGGVMGNVRREMDNIAARYGLDNDEDEDDEGQDDSRWTPEPIALMAAHHLYAQLTAALADAAASNKRPSPFRPEDPEWERSTLPPTLDALADEYLSIEQLAIRVDRRAREWTRSVLGMVLPSLEEELPREEERTEPLSLRERVSLLRLRPRNSSPSASAPPPFVAFLRALDATFKAPRDPAHFRIGISSHDLSNAIFAIRDGHTPAMAPRGVMQKGEGEGGCSALQRARWRRQAGEEGRKEVERRLLMRDAEVEGGTQPAVVADVKVEL
ncbi:hypothetical protein JCM10908_000793 [Rhodotorula pacifica]|uniref:uncharacterized protein n=1 Tax=Rhodotorula pacifica TaxID=1495444 RepID=UPI0031746AC9